MFAVVRRGWEKKVEVVGYKSTMALQQIATTVVITE
jgi:hypothetical protein